MVLCACVNYIQENGRDQNTGHIPIGMDVPFPHPLNLHCPDKGGNLPYPGARQCKFRPDCMCRMKLEPRSIFGPVPKFSLQVCGALIRHYSPLLCCWQDLHATLNVIRPNKLNSPFIVTTSSNFHEGGSHYSLLIFGC